MAQVIQGEKGGKGGGGEARTPVEDPNTLRATNIAQILDLIGEGPIYGLMDGLKSVYLDETPVKNSDGSVNYDGFRLVTRDGYPEQDPIPGVRGIEAETDVSAEVRNDTPIIRTVTNAEADWIRVRVQVPRLTYQDKENGDLKGSSVTFAFDMRQEGATTWTPLGEYTIEGKTTSPYQRSYRLPLLGTGPSWEIRMRRVTADDQGAHVANATFWASYTEVIDAKLSYPDSALIGIEADARQFGSTIPSRAYHIGGRLLQVPSNYDATSRTYSGLWDGTFKTAWSNNPAWVYYDVAKNSRFGAGEEYVDKWALYEIAKYCDEMVDDGYGGTEPRFTCNLVLNTRKEAFEVLDSLSSIFRGMTYWASSQTMPVADMPRDPTKLFTRSNVVGDFEYSGTAKKARHSAVLVSWNDPDDFYRQTVELVEDRDMVQQVGWNQKDVTAIGCSSRGQANRLGKWILYTEKFENETLVFTAGSDAYDLRPGDVINVSDPMVTGARLGGRVLAPGLDQLLLDAVPDDLTGVWEIDVVMPAGGVERREITSFDGETVNLDSPLSQEPIEGAMWMLRNSSQAEPQTFRVLAVEEGDDDLTFSVTALKHHPGKYALVEDGQPLPERPESLIPTGPVGPATNLTLESYTYISGGTEHQGLAVSWTASEDARVQQYQLELKGPSDTDWRQAYTGSGLSTDLPDKEPGTWEARVRGITGMGRPGGWTYRTTNIAGLLVPVPPTSIDIDAQTFTISLRPSGGLPGMQWEFWRSDVALLTENITSNAVKVATTSDLVDSELQPATTYFYYVRGVNAYGVSDWYPTQATTANDASKILQVITDQITENHLYQTLNDRVDLIDGPETLAGSVADRLAQEAADRAAAIASEQTIRSDADSALASDITLLQTETGDNAAAIASEQTARTDADSALASDITLLQAEADGNAAAIASEQTARADADSALASDIDTVQTTLDGQISSVEQSLSSSIDDINGTLSAEYTLKLDADGYVGGMGIANSGDSVTFAVRADTFYIADPNGVDPDISAMPFIVQDGKVYINEAQIGPITVGGISKADGSPITTVGGLIRADAIDAGNLTVGSAATFYGDVASADYQSGVSGWLIRQDGYVEFNDATLRGNLDVTTVTVNGQNATGGINASFSSSSRNRSYNEASGTGTKDQWSITASDTVAEVPEGARIDLEVNPNVPVGLSVSGGAYYTTESCSTGGSGQTYCDTVYHYDSGYITAVTDRLLRVYIGGVKVADTGWQEMATASVSNGGGSKQYDSDSGNFSPYVLSWTAPQYYASLTVSVTVYFRHRLPTNSGDVTDAGMDISWGGSAFSGTLQRLG